MSVQELQAAIAQLSAEELDRFSQWFEEFLADQWDRRIEADILAGRLDAAGEQADKEFEAGRCTPLPGIISPRLSSGFTIACCRMRSATWLISASN
jgi:hypothetical protein